jgi:hypothetical protein
VELAVPGFGLAPRRHEMRTKTFDFAVLDMRGHLKIHGPPLRPRNVRGDAFVTQFEPRLCLLEQDGQYVLDHWAEVHIHFLTGPRI